jgi:NADH:ubiquinone reductase (H+-translocating)
MEFNLRRAEMTQRILIIGAKAKALKRQINSVWIYPPRTDRAAIFAAADPANLVA